MKVKISIIVPIYNTSIYLENCLNSLINQSLKEIEIICINDGSTDNSLEIVEKIASKDLRIKIINQENQGQSVARNVGIQMAQGEYIGFIDSDDWADANMFEKLYQNAQEFKSDVTICSIGVFDEKTEKIDVNDPYMNLNLFPKELEYKSFNYKDCKDFLFRICVTPWNKIYKNSWLKGKSISFPEGLNFEDLVFAVEALIKAEKISIIKEPLVFYRKESQTSYSVGKSSKDHKKIDFFEVYEKIASVLKENNVYEIFEEYFLFYKKKNLIYWYEKIQDKNVKKIYYKKLIQLYPEFRLYSLLIKLKKFTLRQKIKKLTKTKKIMVWGARDLPQSILPKNNVNILGFVDSNPELYGNIIKGYEIFSINKLQELKPDCILAITQNYYKFSNIVKRELSDKNLEFDVIDMVI